MKRRDYRGVYNIRSSSAFAVAEQISARPRYFSKQILENLDVVVSNSKLAYHLLINSLLDIITTISCSPFIRICRNPSLAYSLGQLC